MWIWLWLDLKSINEKKIKKEGKVFLILSIYRVFSFSIFDTDDIENIKNLMFPVTWSTNSSVFGAILGTNQSNGTFGVIGTNLCPARIHATTSSAILRIYELFFAVRTTNHIAFLASFRTRILFILLGVDLVSSYENTHQSHNIEEYKHSCNRKKKNIKMYIKK